MNQAKTKPQTPESVNPLDIIKPEWEVGRKSVEIDSLIAKYVIQPPDELTIPLTTHHTIILQISYGNEQITRIGDEKYEGAFNPGEFFLHPANHSGFYSWSTTDEAISLILEPTYLRRLAEETECLNPDRIELLPIVCDRDPHLEYIARSFLSEMQNDGLGGKLYSEALATQLGIHLLRNYCAFPTTVKQFRDGLSPYKTKQAIDYIQSHFTEEIGLTRISQLVGLSQFHFVRQFKKSVGITPHQYVMQQRVEMAKRLLKQQILSIADVALDCGFASQSHLCRVFKAHTGTTPKKYRESL